MSECEVKEKSETYVIAIANVPHPIPLHMTAHGLISHGNMGPFLSLPITTFTMSKPLVANLDTAIY